MITFVEGILEEALPTQVVVDVHGVGYHMLIPLSSFDRLPTTGQKLRMLTYLHVREDAMTLYGFQTASERDLFRLLIDRVSGIGPKLALAVLSGMTVAQFKAAVSQSDITSISKISGIGKKTAERIVLELKDRVGVVAAWEAASAANAASAEETAVNDAVLALISLGFKQVEAHKAVKAVFATLGEEKGSSEALLREALKRLS